jgi:hypothetical protein
MRTRRLAAAAIFLTFLSGACSNQRASRNAPEPAASATVSAAQPTASPAPLKLEGKFSTTPTHGPLGSPFTATATGMSPNTDYTVVWTTVVGSWKLANDDTQFMGRQFKPAEQVLARTKTDAQGNFQLSSAVPDEDFGFQHDIQVKRGDEIHNKAGFDVDTQASISPKSGPPGTPITIDISGIGWRSLEASWRLSYDNSYTGWMSAVTTKGHARAVIPATGGPGVHVLSLVQGVPTFPYLNPQQSPEPGVPLFHLPFTVTSGNPVMPPDPALQRLPVSASKQPGQGPALWVDPPEGVVGTPATVHAIGLTPNADVSLGWTTQSGSRVAGPGIQEQSKQLATVKADGQGNLAWPLTIPDDLGGVHTVIARSGEKALAQGQLTIQPSAEKLSVDRGPSGTDFTLHLKGVGWTETANIYNVVWDNSYTGFACGVNSAGDVQVSLPAAGAPGWHYIDLYPGIYKGKEPSSLDLDFRIPQLTYADDHPGEKLPAFHFAFFISSSGA